MSDGKSAPKDHWSSEKYRASASFVPELASQILEWLDPQPTDRILDIGCGDGRFTSRFIPAVTAAEGEIYGIDSSATFVKEANTVYGTGVSGRGSVGSVGDDSQNNAKPDESKDVTIKNVGGKKPKISFKVVDARNLDQDTYAVNGSWDKVVSNAALHWILAIPPSSLSKPSDSDPTKMQIEDEAGSKAENEVEVEVKVEKQQERENSLLRDRHRRRQQQEEQELKRHQIFQDIYNSLKPNGTSKFVFEFGGAGNVSEVVSVVVALLIRDGLVVPNSYTPRTGANTGTTRTVDEVIPWFFPDVKWTTKALEKVGFRVDRCELVDRPTRLNEVQTDIIQEQEEGDENILTEDGTPKVRGEASKRGGEASKRGGGRGGGVEGWVRLMLAGVIDFYAEQKGEDRRDGFVREIVDAIEVVADRRFAGHGEGGMWLGNVRLRGVATKV